MKIIVTALLFSLSIATATEDHIGLLFTKSGLNSLIYSAISKISLSEKTEPFEIQLDNREYKLPLERGDGPVASYTFNIINNLLGIEVRDRALFLRHGDLKMATNFKKGLLKSNIVAVSASEFDITASVALDNLVASTPIFSICTTSDCKRELYLKFKNVKAVLTKGVPLIFTFKARLEKDETKISFKIISIKTNMDASNGPRIKTTYFKGSDGKNSWPVVAQNQIGPADSGLSVTSEDIDNQFKKVEDDLSKLLLQLLAEFMANDYVEIMNEMIGGYNSINARVNGKFESRKLVANSGSDQVNQLSVIDRTYVAKNNIFDRVIYPTLLDKVLYEATYDIFVSDLKLSDRGFLKLFFDSELSIERRSVSIGNTIGYGSCNDSKKGNCVRRLGEFENNISSDVAIYLSESILDGILNTSMNTGALERIFSEFLKVQGVKLGRDGIKLHILNERLYLICNLIIDLSKQPSWLDRRVGNMYERIFGNSGGKVFFPLEIPLYFDVRNNGEDSYIVVRGESPFYQNGMLRNMHGYPTNLNGQASCSSDRECTEMIRNKIVAKLKLMLDQYLIDGKIELDPYPLSILKKLPINILPTAVKMTKSGHLSIEGNIRGIR